MKEITIVAPTKHGFVAELAELLGNAGINIESIDAFEVHDWDIVQLIVDRYDQALTILRDAGLHAITEDAIVVRLRDEPGALARAAKRLHEAAVNVRSLRILQRQGENVLVAISVEDRQRAMAVLEDVMIKNL